MHLNFISFYEAKETITVSVIVLTENSPVICTNLLQFKNQ